MWLCCYACVRSHGALSLVCFPCEGGRVSSVCWCVRLLLRVGSVDVLFGTVGVLRICWLSVSARVARGAESSRSRVMRACRSADGFASSGACRKSVHASGVDGGGVPYDTAKRAQANDELE